MRQPFTIFYRREATASQNGIRSAMIGVLNAIGEWMEEQDKPYLGDWLSVDEFEQVQLASIAEQADRFATYQAGYILGYTTK